MKYSKKQLREKQKTQAQLSRLVQDSQGLARPAAPQQEQAPVRAPKRGATSAKKPAAAKPQAKSGQAGKKTLKKAAAPRKAESKKLPKNTKKIHKPKNRESALQDFRDMPAVRRKKRKRNAILYIMIVLLLVGIALISSVTIFFNIINIEVIGDSRYSKDKIESASGILEGQNMFRLDKFEIEQSMVKQLPYLKTVSIKRKLPDTLEIHVEDTTAVAAVKTAAGYVLIDTDSKMLELVAQQPETTVEVIGADLGKYEPGETAEFGNESAAELIRQLVTELKSAGIFDGTTSINVTKRHDLSIVYNSVIQCKLGTVSDLSVKIKMIAEVLKENPLDTKAEIDATDANRVYYRPEYK